MRTKYLDYLGHYALLASFHAAFIAPLDQDVAIAEACEDLRLTALEIGSRRQPVPIQLASFDRQTAWAQLVAVTGLFEALGNLLSTAFTITDFMRDARLQNQDDY